MTTGYPPAQTAAGADAAGVGHDGRWGGGGMTTRPGGRDVPAIAPAPADGMDSTDATVGAAIPVAIAPAVARFWAKVNKTDTCWLWTGAILGGGYGQIRWGTHGRRMLAHRLSYEINVGPIPDGLQIDHLCRVRNCVRPDHLEPVTQRVNVLRGIAPSAVNATKTECDHGHPFTTANTYITPRGHRTCRACNLVSVYAYRARRRPPAA